MADSFAVQALETEDGTTTVQSQFIVSPIKARTGWTLLVVGLFLMICGGNTHFCENFANRKPDAPNSVESYPIMPMWPPTISTMSADILSPAGRFFFVFMLLGGGFVVQSNVLPMSFADDVHLSPGTTYMISSAMCLGTILVGCCPTQLMQRADEVANAPFIKKQNVSTAVHMVGAACAFILMPLCELTLTRKMFHHMRSMSAPAANSGISIFRRAVASFGLCCFVAFQACNLFCMITYSDFITHNSCGGFVGNSCRGKFLGWFNALGFWLEYACASSAIALLAARIYFISPEKLTRLGRERKWIIRLDDPLVFGFRDIGVKGAIIFQVTLQLVSIAVLLYNRTHQRELCCMCSVFGVDCQAIYKKVNNGTALCTSQVLHHTAIRAGLSRMHSV
mmetsp:Transcript_55034/g.154801  ORF Transcript_55034/g.154801 Transcript_55034/m.154801 type:complete len:394 (-) Transcript_55034:117-1298(-)